MFLEAFPGLDVTVLVDGQQVAEYDDEGTFPSNKEKSKYIEAVSDANFAIKLSGPRALARVPGDCINCKVYLDGKYVNGVIMELGSLAYGTRDHYEYTLKGRIENSHQGGYLERYQFAQLQTNDGPVGKAKLEDFKHLGEIKVEFSWCRIQNEIPDAYNVNTFESAIGQNVPEKCLKGRAISNRATLGAREYTAKKTRTVSTTYPYGNNVFATFVFKYRARGDLQVEGIIPRSPSPIPLEERDPDDLSPEEARELVRRLRVQQQQQQIEVKKEGQKKKQKKRARSDTPDVDDDSDGLVVTGASSSRKRSRQSTDSGIELIDLTVD